MWPIVAGAGYIPEAGQLNDYQLNRRENAWLLYSASDQATLDAGLPHLLTCRDLVPVLGLSLEPLLGPVDLRKVGKTLRGDDVDALYGTRTKYQYKGREGECSMGVSISALPKGPALDWVVVGGESGPNARSCNVEWIRSIVRQCTDARVPCFVKQLGANVEACDIIDAADYFVGHFISPLRSWFRSPSALIISSPLKRINRGEPQFREFSESFFRHSARRIGGSQRRRRPPSADPSPQVVPLKDGAAVPQVFVPVAGEL
jgi:hypothetical protein